MKRRVRSNARSLFIVLFLFGAVLITSFYYLLPARASIAIVPSLDACSHTPKGSPGFYNDIPCGEVNRAIREAAAEFSIDETRFRRLIRCESRFNPFVGRKYKGLVQANSYTGGFWSTQVPEFNRTLRAGQPPVLGNIHAPFDNARVGARVISLEGYGQWDPRCRP